MCFCLHVAHHHGQDVPQGSYGGKKIPYRRVLGPKLKLSSLVASAEPAETSLAKECFLKSHIWLYGEPFRIYRMPRGESELFVGWSYKS